MGYRRRNDKVLTLVRWPDTNPRLLVRDFLWGLRHWRAIEPGERLRSRLGHAWHYAWTVFPRDRSNDRVKYG